MKLAPWTALACLLTLANGVFAQGLSGNDSRALLDQAQSQQAAGDYPKARATLFQAVKQFPNDAAVARAQARFLDAAGDPARRPAYRHALELQSDPAVERRLAMLDLAAGDTKALSVLKVQPREPAKAEISGAATVHLPGPIPAFRRLAAISLQTSDADLLAMLSRNIFTMGFHYSQRLSKSEPTEYLLLVRRYVEMARELEKLAGPDGEIHIANCESAQPLLGSLGYRLRKGGCGAQAVLETDEPGRAFLTIDSGFPLAELEAAFRAGKPFQCRVRGADVPILFGADTWFDSKQDPLDQLLDNHDMARLYYAMSKLDSRTANLLRHAAGVPRLVDVAPVLDFFSETFALDNGHVTLPGGPEHLDQWAKMVGADPAKPAEFLFALADKDNGWLAAYADSLAQLDPPQQAYYFANGRLERFYQALRGSNTTPGAARPLFRPNAEMLILPRRMRFGADGQPLIPGGAATWKALFTQALPKKTPKNALPTLNDADDVIAALYAKIRQYEENGLLNVYVTVNEVDRRRTHPLEPATVQALSHEYGRFSHHYAVFADWPEISDAGIIKFIKACDTIVKIKAPLVKGDALGTFQATVGLWEIFARQGQIPASQLGSSFDALVSPFQSGLDSGASVFDAGRGALENLMAAVGASNVHPVTAARAGGVGGVQETLIAQLAGGSGSESADPDGVARQRAHEYLATQIRSVMDAQRLLKLDTLLGIADVLKGTTKASQDALLRLAGQLREFRLPVIYVSAAERNGAFPGFWTEKHLDQLRDIDVGKLVEKKDRGLLAPFLRDTLVGFNYAYFAPPGAQVLYHNPLFVRSHDFMGRSGAGTGNEIWGPGKISGTGWPLSGGGRLVGSLSGLPYALAEAEQDFLIPRNTQALIWSDLAPQLLAAAVMPRWWKVTANQQRWVAANQRFGEDLVAESAVSPEVRAQVAVIFRGKLDQRRREQLEVALDQAHTEAALSMLTPGELYQLGRAWNASVKIDSPAQDELKQLAAAAPQEVSDAAISAVFGVPHPKLARSWRLELAGMAPYPAMQGYSSRLLAESWESNALQFARLADEMNMSPASLQWVAPQLTQKMLERIFANHHEDWPAMLRALHETSDEYRHQPVTE